MVRLTTGLHGAGSVARVFKSRWFTREARRLGISDGELLCAASQIFLGQGDQLGGGVWKKRLNGNRDRAIVLAKGACHFFFVHAFAKSAMDNIRCDELLAFRRLADIYACYDAARLADLTASGVLIEVKK